MDVREEERVDDDGGDEGSLPRQPDGGGCGWEGGAFSVNGVDDGGDGGDGGYQREGVAREEEEGLGAEDRNGVVAGLLPHVASLEVCGGEAGEGLEVVDAGPEGVGGEGEGEEEGGEREGGEGKNGKENLFVSQENFEGFEEDFGG